MKYFSLIVKKNDYKESSLPTWLMVTFYQTVKEELIQFFTNSSLKKDKRKEILLYEASIILISNQNIYHKKRKL